MIDPTWLTNAAVIDRAPSHTREAFDTRTMRKIAQWMAGEVIAARAEAIVANGHSGLPVAGAVSYLTGVPLFATRKKNEETVALSDPVTGYTRHGVVSRWIWIDDLFSGGSTLLRSARDIIKAGLVTPRAVRPMFALLYKGRTEPEYYPSENNWEKYHPDYEGPKYIITRSWRDSAEGKAHYHGTY